MPKPKPVNSSVVLDGAKAAGVRDVIILGIDAEGRIFRAAQTADVKEIARRLREEADWFDEIDVLVEEGEDGEMVNFPVEREADHG